MTRNTTNIIGIVITLLAGTYFFVMYCSECGDAVSLVSTGSDVQEITTIHSNMQNSAAEVPTKNLSEALSTSDLEEEDIDINE